MDKGVQADFHFSKIYLDTCCLSRIFESTNANADSAEKPKLPAKFSPIVLVVVGIGLSVMFCWTKSTKTQISGVRFQIKNWMTLAHQTVSVGANESKRGMQLEDLGFKRRDALHLACAESAEADIFLTTDDRLLRRAKRYQMQLHTQVENPDIWLQPEV